MDIHNLPDSIRLLNKNDSLINHTQQEYKSPTESINNHHQNNNIEYKMNTIQLNGNETNPQKPNNNNTNTNNINNNNTNPMTSVLPPSTATSLASITHPPRSRYKTFILSAGVFEVEQRYEVREIVGQGAYGLVCSALDLKTNQMVAVKKIENIFEHRSLAKRTLRELKLVRSFAHENIMSLERVMRPHSSTFNNLYLVSELMETDLACVIRSPQELTDEHCQFFIYQVLRGLKYIHSANVIHRDLKPRNLLVNSNCDLKICDFGLARLDDPDNSDRAIMSSYIATRWYRAPEVILGKKRYGKAVDMWSVGCILAELIGRKPLFPGRDSFHQITLITSIIGTPPPDNDSNNNVNNRTSNKESSSVSDFISALPRKNKLSFQSLFHKSNPLACDLLDHLLCFDPDKRYTVEQALKHPYLEELHCEDDEPINDTFDAHEFYYEYLKTTKDDLRILIHQEVVNHYKEDTYECQTQTSQVVTVKTNNKNIQSNNNKQQRTRRKSF